MSAWCVPQHALAMSDQLSMIPNQYNHISSVIIFFEKKGIAIIQQYSTVVKAPLSSMLHELNLVPTVQCSYTTSVRMCCIVAKKLMPKRRPCQHYVKSNLYLWIIIKVWFSTNRITKTIQLSKPASLILWWFQMWFLFYKKIFKVKFKKS